MPGLIKNKLAKTIFISLLIAVIASMLFFSGFLQSWENQISDSFYYPTNTDNRIIIIAIDDESIQELGLMKDWSREYYAKVIKQLNQSKVIGVDIIFDVSTDNDSILADSLKDNNVVLAMMYGDDFTIKDGEPYGESVIKPTINLGNPQVDYKLGFVNLYADSDKIVRTFSPTLEGIENHDHFSLAVAEEYLGYKPDLKDKKMLINFFSKPGDYEYRSFYEVYNKTIPAGYFKDKIVLIGATSQLIHDDYPVPISEQSMPGVEIHANLVQSIITEKYLFHQDDISAVCIIFLFALITGFLLYKFKIHIATFIIILIFVVYFILSIQIFVNLGIIMKILFPLFSITLTYIPLVALYYVTEERSRKWITNAFGRYVSKVIIDNLIKNPEKLKLGGEKRNITLFFSDIRKFTTISEKLSPEELVRLLNDYLTEMTNIIMKDEGLVDKYMGDAIMAFWGAPIDQPNHPELACSCSLEMMEKLKELQKKWKEEGIPSFNIGIGLNSGDAIVGNMGSKDRFDYTATGDSVNTASRMEGLNKVYGTNIIISDNTYIKVKDKFETRKLDAVLVKGKKKPIHIYELLAPKDKLSQKDTEFVNYYEKGLELYFKKDWKQAIKFFNKSLKIKKDFASIMFIDRCKEFRKNPPPKDWDGVWEMKIK